jgi:hypothetical protein
MLAYGDASRHQTLPCRRHVAVDGGPRLHQLAPEVVDVVGDQPNVLSIVAGSRTSRVEPPLSRMASPRPNLLGDAQVWRLLFDPPPKVR